jgi:hypothetical protein
MPKNGALQGNFTQIPFIGPWLQNMGLASNPYEDKLAADMQELQRLYAQYRPQMAEAKTQGLQQQLMAYQPVNKALSSMYGPEYQFDLQGMGQNPMPQGMTELGNDFGQPKNVQREPARARAVARR